ncbi:MAG TPA: RluA family pseudouridine synthase [Planctomycetaceae bacterium]|nr:RluA family pseudouridine synthase [Planctomycetaceae bacterium]
MHAASLPSASGTSNGKPSPLRLRLVVEHELRGVRIDSFLMKHLRNYTRYRLQRMVQAGLVKANDSTAALDQRVYRGQRIEITLIEPPDKLLQPEAGPLDVLFEDAWIVVLNKPPGMVAHPAADTQQKTLINRLQWHLDRQTPLPGLLRPGIVHRLDRETSGVMVTTKHHLPHSRLGEQFERGRVSKAYLALVEGVIERNEGTIDLPIGRVAAGDSILMSAKADAREAKPSRTRFEVVRRFAAHTLVRAIPLSGRQHQIRIHLAESGHPVVGDEFYGPFGAIKRQRGEPDLRAAPSALGTVSPLIARHALHAERLGFTHPVTEDWLEFTAPLPGDFERALAQLDGPVP